MDKVVEVAEAKAREAVRELQENQNDVEGMVGSLEAMEKTLALYKQREVSLIRR